VARDRQRAKQRKARRAAQNPGPAPSEPHRSNLPGELDHASGEADEFDAAIVSGAGGRSADEPGAETADDVVDNDRPIADDDGPTADNDRLTADDVVDPDGIGEVYEDELVGIDEEAERDEELDGEDEDLDEPDPELEQEAVAAAPARARRAAERTDRAGAAAPSRGIFARFAAFLRASWAELQRVQWPDRRQVAQATAVVLGFVVIAGLYLGVADRVAQEVVDFII
jgi:preprotein translocase subunit SecE